MATVVPTDDELWGQVRAGDATSFGVLFRRHHRTVYNYCFRRTGDWALAEDLMGTVFLEAWRRRDKALEPGKVLPWLLGIATNVVRNRRRSQRRHAAALARIAPLRAADDFSDEIAARVDDERQMRRVLATVGRLSRIERDVVALCLWSELSYEDAAAALGIPVGTVRSRLARARTRLQELSAVSSEDDDGAVEARDVRRNEA